MDELRERNIVLAKICEQAERYDGESKSLQMFCFIYLQTLGINVDRSTCVNLLANAICMYE